MVKYWYKNSVIYSLDVDAFRDSNGDGVGDLTGLTQSLTYLSGFGVTCIWLLPFFPTPNKDDGYDISDYYSVDPRLGNMGGFVEFLDAAQELGIRVIIDLVFNHTSDQHPWFVESRKNKDSKYRKYYIWVKEKPEDEEKLIFGEEQDGNWEHDKTTDSYYYHTFYKHQPDLNLSNPEVQKEIQKIMHFWLKLGVAGFRMDAVPHMIRQKGNEKFEGDPHQVLRDLRKFVDGQRSDAVLLAEVDTEPEKYRDFFGEGKEIHMLFNFYLNNYLFLAFARKQAGPVIQALNALPKISGEEQMATFLRNHDELDLERLNEEEREEVYKAFAPEEDMRIFGRGIRRRLPPMFDNDRQRMELAYSLLFTLPGTPVIRYGEELGMGEDLSQKGRSSVRTVMQWSREKNGGFSTAKPENLARPVIEKGENSFKKINVNDQRSDPDSFLNWMERAVRTRKICPEFGWGEYKLVETEYPSILLHYCEWNNELAMAVHNFSDEPARIQLKIKEIDTKHLLKIFEQSKNTNFDQETGSLELGRYGYCWFRKSTYHE